MPREAGSAELRRRIQDTLAAALHGTLVYFYLALGEGYTARLHFCFVADPPRLRSVRALETDDRRARQTMGRSLAGAVDRKIRTQARTRARRAMGRRIQRRLSGCDRRNARGRRHRRRRSAARRRPRFQVEAGRQRVRRPPRRRRATYGLSGLGDAPMLSDLMPTVAELRHRGAGRGRSRASPPHRRQSDARVPAGFFRARTRRAAARQISRRARWLPTRSPRCGAAWPRTIR